MSANAGKHNPVIVALDFDDLDKALALIEKVRSRVGLFKVGLELFAQYGPACVTEVKARGVDVFLDLKLHDIPNTVGKASAQLCALGVKFFTVHSTGGVARMKAAARAAGEYAAGGHLKPCILGVSILTSIDRAACQQEIGFSLPPEQMVPKCARNMLEAGLGGIVCSPSEAMLARAAAGDGLVIVTPGVRPLWAATGDQDPARVMTPLKALAQGADYLVIGRPITAASDPLEAAVRVAGEIASFRG